MKPAESRLALKPEWSALLCLVLSCFVFVPKQGLSQGNTLDEVLKVFIQGDPGQTYHEAVRLAESGNGLTACLGLDELIHAERNPHNRDPILALSLSKQISTLACPILPMLKAKLHAMAGENDVNDNKNALLTTAISLYYYYGFDTDVTESDADFLFTEFSHAAKSGITRSLKELAMLRHTLDGLTACEASRFLTAELGNKDTNSVSPKFQFSLDYLMKARPSNWFYYYYGIYGGSMPFFPIEAEAARKDLLHAAETGHPRAAFRIAEARFQKDGTFNDIETLTFLLIAAQADIIEANKQIEKHRLMDLPIFNKASARANSITRSILEGPGCE